MSANVALAPRPWLRRVILLVIGGIFLIPIASMVEFTMRRGLEGGHDFSRWIAVFSGDLGNAYRTLWEGIGNSVVLAIVTVALVMLLLVPTMILVALKFPKLKRVLEFLCLLPLTIPAIVLVVGLAPVYQVVARIAGSGAWTLALAYGVLVLPFAYRAVQSNIDSIDMITLSEAARSLGAGWPIVVMSVLVPNLRRGLLAAAFISVAVVLGEYTVASLLSRTTLQTALVIASKADAFVAVIFALLALLFAFALLLVIGRIGGGKNRRTT
ncbi:MAG: ABC transporter permease subunit [Microcella sp.]|nr:ABC transporter permease subunit [Microcella sp.]